MLNNHFAKDRLYKAFLKTINFIVRRWPSQVIEALKELLIENDILSLCLENRNGIFTIGNDSENKGKKISTSYGFFNIFEPCETALMADLAKKSKVVFDIGANVGWYTVLFASNPECKVFAFEPIPDTFEQLKKTVSLNGFDNCITEQVVISDYIGKATMHLPRGFSYTAASLCKHRAHFTKDYALFECDTETLDNYIKTHNITSVDLIKCDVEGAELLVLKGASNLLASPDAPILLLESDDRWAVTFNYTRKELFEFMSNMGFFIYEIVPDKAKATIRQINSFSGKIAGANFLFVKDSKKFLIESIICG